jgi:hypothetical protein
LFISCTDREVYNNATGPEITGLFKEIKGKVSGELTLDNSPYKAISDIIIDSGSTFKINAGVEIYFIENTKLIVHGELIISGNYYKSVFLDSYDETKSWCGIKIINADKQSIIDFASIKGIREPGDSTNYTSSIFIENSDVTILHSIISENSAIHGGAIGVYNAKIILKNNLIRNNSADVFGGAIVSELSDLHIINNTFYKNNSFNSFGGVLVYNPVKTELQNNIFYKNTSNSGQINFQYSSIDSSTLTEQYNYFATGTMDPIFWDDIYLTLYFTSPCRDAGNPDPVFNDYNGSRNDQGAYGGPLGDWY